VTASAEFSATITDIQLESREGAEVRWRMTLSHTQFQPGDTGVLEAVSRSGTRIEIPVLRVISDDSGDIWHTVEKPLAAGTDVVGRINPQQ
jgi:Ser-tRNA(Ala) deacylase AlaX